MINADELRLEVEDGGPESTDVGEQMGMSNKHNSKSARFAKLRPVSAPRDN